MAVSRGRSLDSILNVERGGSYIKVAGFIGVSLCQIQACPVGNENRVKEAGRW